MSWGTRRTRRLVLAAALLAGCSGLLIRSATPDGTSDAGPTDLPLVEQRTSDGARPDTRSDARPHLDAPPPDLGPQVWRPKPGTTWQWQLEGKIDTSVDAQMYDIDLFNSTPALIADLQAKGRKVICYLSITYEQGRPDGGQFPESAKGEKLSGWNELWLDIRNQKVRQVITARLDLARSKGCDGVEPDNVDAYLHDSGFPLTAQDQLDFNTWIAAQAHARHLSVGLKNDNDQVKALLSHFDWALSEQCLKGKACDELLPFIQANKAVFHVEYKPATKASVCPQTTPLGFSTMIKKLALDAWYEACW